MKIQRLALEASVPQGPAALTLGLFDGVHRGHQALLAAAVEGARRRSVKPVAVTFDPHPTVVVAPEGRPKLLMTLEQRLAAFEEAGVALAWVVPFSRALSELEPETFLGHLQRALAPVELHVGRAFRFGRHRSGGLDTLESWGARTGCVVLGHAFRAPDGGPLSSTRIREALDRGNAEEARDLLGHPYGLTGIVVEGERRGRHLGFPTANLAWEQEQLPARGVYVTEVRGAHLGHPRLGLTNIGEKPTFDGLKLTVETFLPDFQGDLYGGRLEVGFLHRLRPERRFEGMDALREQISRDVEAGRTWWREHGHP